MSYNEKSPIRAYLLGTLASAEIEPLELRFLTDEEFAEEVEIVEDELIDEYVAKTLNARERGQFEMLFLPVPARREKIEFARALKYRLSNAGATQGDRTGLSAAMRAEHDGALLAGAEEISRNSIEATTPPAAFVKLAGRDSLLARIRAFGSLKIALVSVLVGLGLVVGALWLLRGRADDSSDLARGLAAYQQAFGERRMIEPRVTLLESYTRYDKTRGAADSQSDLLRDQAEKFLLAAVTEHPQDSAARHALGRFYLSAGETDKALEQLRQARIGKPDDAQILSDLGAAQLAAGLRGVATDAGTAYISLNESLANLERALALQPALLPARFNRALCLEAMKLRAEAVAAWDDYLQADGNSGWAQEAQRHKTNLTEQKTQAANPQLLLATFLDTARDGDKRLGWDLLRRNRDAIAGQVIPPQLAQAFLAQSLDGQTAGAQVTLRAFVFAGEIEREQTADRMTADSAEFYKTANPETLRVLQAAHAALQAGYRACLKDNYKTAQAEFTQARADFDRAGSRSESLLAAYWMAYTLAVGGNEKNRYEQSDALLDEILLYAVPRNYKWLAAQAHGWRGINEAKQGKPSSALRHYQIAAQLAAEVGDGYQTQKMLTELGAAYTVLQQPVSAAAAFYRSLSNAFDENLSPRQAQRNYIYAATSLADFRYYAAAAACAREALRHSAEINDPLIDYPAHLTLAEAYGSAGRFAEAHAAAARGLELAQANEDQAVGREWSGTALLTQAQLWRAAGDCARADEFYAQAIAIFDTTRYELRRYPAYKGRLMCAVARGDTPTVERDLPVLLDLFEKYRDRIQEKPNRDSFFDTAQGVYDLAIGYALQHGDANRAFEYAELSRARSLLAALNRNPAEADSAHAIPASASPPLNAQLARPLTTEELQQRLPSGAQLVIYSVLPDKTVIWTLTRARLATTTQAITADALRVDVEDFARTVADNRPAAQARSREIAQRLYRQLFAPVAAQLDKSQPVYFIPDKFLYRVPFAALVAPESKRYLIEDWTPAYAPGTTIFTLLSEAARSRGNFAAEQIVSVGNPAFDRSAYPALPDLTDAAHEAESIAALYPGGRAIVGAMADKATVRAALKTADVFHYAGHYLSDPSAPSASRMVLAQITSNNNSDAKLKTAGQNPAEILTADEIARADLRRTKLVVLSACNTRLDRYYDGEGAVGLARSFLTAGVPQVVASQWAVDSAATANLMIDFQTRRRNGTPVVGALRTAQLAMLNGKDATYAQPYYWAAFLAVGGA